jgi:hypothetical protein
LICSSPRQRENNPSRSARHLRKALSVAAEFYPWLRPVAEDLHPGFTQLESSSVPAMIIVTLGIISASSMSVDPHSGQKRR